MIDREKIVDILRDEALKKADAILAELNKPEKKEKIEELTIWGEPEIMTHKIIEKINQLIQRMNEAGI